MRAALHARLLGTAARLRGLPADENGNVLIYVSLTAALLLGVVGLALDGSRFMITHSEAQAAADAAALAGASQLDMRASACTDAKAEASAVVNTQRFAQGGGGNVTIAAGSPLCLSDLPPSDSTAVPSGMVTTSGPASRYVQVTTQQLTHQNTFLDAVSNRTTVVVQGQAVAGFKRTLCPSNPVMMMCDNVSWTPGVAFDAWKNAGGPLKGFLSDCGNPNAPCVETTLASTTPSYCVSDPANLTIAQGNKTNKADQGINTRFGQGSKTDPPSDLDIADFTSSSPSTKTSYSNDLNGGNGWNCSQYLKDYHTGDTAFAAHFSSCTTTETSTSRYSVYQYERADNKIPAKWQPPKGIPTTTAERRLFYLAIYNCSGNTNVPEAYLKAFMIAPAGGPSNFTIFVEPIGLSTSKNDPAIHEEVQLYR
jgi:Flp pilus assembly protein TadG